MADPNQHTPPEEENTAPTDDPGFFRYTDRPGEHGPLTPIMDSEKYRIAKKVYERLVQAKGDFRYPIPNFVMSRDERMVAWMNYGAVQIGLEEKAYDVCAAFGPLQDAAIATLLGHELTHYYEKHAWRRGFAAEFRDLDIGLKLDKIRDNILNETQADYLGGFLAYSAGFDVFDKTPDFIAQVYKAYGFPDELGDNYPCLADRQTLARRSAARMKQLIDIFNMANWLNAIDRLDEAHLYYRYILREYQSRELYNNLGVLYVRRALKKFKQEEMPFLLPLELDLSAVRSSSREIDLEREHLLREAILQFDYAIGLAPNYATAYLNKAAAHTLLQDLVRAQFYAETEALHRAEAADQKQVIADTEVLLGIIAALRDDQEKAHQYLDQAIARGSSLARINKEILNGKVIPTSDEATFPEEQIDGVNLLDFAESPSYDEDISYAINESVSLLQNPNPTTGGHSHIQIHYNADTSELIVVHLTDADYPDKTAKGIGIGAAEQEILNNYGEPVKRIAGPQGSLLVYSNLLFLLDDRNNLRRWAVYRSQSLY